LQSNPNFSRYRINSYRQYAEQPVLPVNDNHSNKTYFLSIVAPGSVADSFYRAILITCLFVCLFVCDPGYSSPGHRSLGGHATNGDHQQSSMTTGHPSPSSSASVASAAVAAVAAAVRKSCFDSSHSSVAVASTAAAAAAAAVSVAPWRPQGSWLHTLAHTLHNRP
jgi:hypothetical protein